ncbi:hypothetical protein ACFYVK_35415 [Streptomyces chartreusis]|uniref:hypothetical protein n=1 Tax=Streptomyces chartreusis TaxID=1969 RepID=UPI0036797DCB
MASNTDLPKWVWDLTIAMLNHEDEHGADSTCLNAVVSAIPVDVREQAEAIRSYVQAAGQSSTKDHIESTWNTLMDGFSGFKAPKTSDGEATP